MTEHEHSNRKAAWSRLAQFALIWVVCLLLPGLAFANSSALPGASSYIPPDFSEACPDSKEWAKPWNSELLKPDELTGPLAFLAVPYPYRDFLEAKRLFDTAYPYLSSFAKLDDDLAKYREVDTRKMSTKYTDSSLSGVIFGRIKHYTVGFPEEHIYRFVIDEGCGTLTVWRVGVFTRAGRIVDTIIRRSFDDYDFSRRKISFRIRDFDQRIIREKEYMIIDRALRALTKDQPNKALAISMILIDAGFKGGLITRRDPRRDPNRQTYGFTYLQDYRKQLQDNWGISFIATPQGDLLQHISTNFPGTTWP